MNGLGKFLDTMNNVKIKVRVLYPVVRVVKNVKCWHSNSNLKLYIFNEGGLLSFSNHPRTPPGVCLRTVNNRRPDGKIEPWWLGKLLNRPFMSLPDFRFEIATFAIKNLRIWAILVFTRWMDARLVAMQIIDRCSLCCKIRLVFENCRARCPLRVFIKIHERTFMDF